MDARLKQFNHDVNNALAIIKNMAKASIHINTKLTTVLSSLTDHNLSPQELALFTKSLQVIMDEARTIEALVAQISEDVDDE